MEGVRQEEPCSRSQLLPVANKLPGSSELQDVGVSARLGLKLSWPGDAHRFERPSPGPAAQSDRHVPRGGLLGHHRLLSNSNHRLQTGLPRGLCQSDLDHDPKVLPESVVYRVPGFACSLGRGKARPGLSVHITRAAFGEPSVTNLLE